MSRNSENVTTIKAAKIGAIATIVAAVLGATIGIFHFDGCSNSNRSEKLFISGIIKDSSDVTISGAHIQVIGSAEETLSESNGNFRLQIQESTEKSVKAVRLRITHSGYISFDKVMIVPSEENQIILKKVLPNEIVPDYKSKEDSLSKNSTTDENERIPKPEQVLQNKHRQKMVAKKYFLKSSNGNMIDYYTSPTESDSYPEGRISSNTDLVTKEILNEGYIKRIKFEFYEPSKRRYITRWIKMSDLQP